MTGMIEFIKKWIGNSTGKQKLFASLITFSLLATAALMSISDTSGVSKGPLGSTPFYYLSAFVKLIAVLLLIVGSSVIFRRWLQPGMGGKAARQMHLVETIRLSPKQSLHLVMIGDQRLLIGATDQNVSLIAPIESELAPVADAESQPQQGLDFGSMIQSFNFPPVNSQGKE
jgi:flagellar biosynthetic protein FliO